MTVKVHDFVARLLSEYENITGETPSKIAGDMDIPVSNYCLYRNGMGNPTGNTINKMVAVIQTNRPEVLIETIQRLLWQLMESAPSDEENAFVLF